MFEVDCTEYPLICQLRAPVINERQEDRSVDDEIRHPDCPDMTAQGYRTFTYNETLFVEDIYDGSTVRVIDGVPTVHAFTVNEKMIGREDDLTWDEIRAIETLFLKVVIILLQRTCSTDMKNTWKAYRQKLRDLPGDLETAGVSPNIAYYMFPSQPFFTTPDSDPEPPADATADWRPTFLWCSRTLIKIEYIILGGFIPAFLMGGIMFELNESRKTTVKKVYDHAKK